MLTNSCRKMLIELIKNGIISFEILSNESDEKLKSILNMSDIETIKSLVLEAFKYGYIKTSDGELYPDNLSHINKKILILNIEKMFNDEIFSCFDEYEDLKTWFDNCGEDILLSVEKAIFISELEDKEFYESSKAIAYSENKILNVIKSLANKSNPREEKLLIEASKDIFLIHSNIILNEISKLPYEYKYAKELYSLKNYYKMSVRNNSKLFKDINRNDLCVCGSGKKFKKCCME